MKDRRIKTKDGKPEKGGHGREYARYDNPAKNS